MTTSLVFKQGRGFTLVETLVAILIIAIGLFGMLGLVVKSIKLSSSSNYRSIAAQQATAIAETLRANPITLGVSSSGDANFAAPISSVSTSCLSAGGCARDALVGSEYGLWKEQLASTLPSGDGVVCRDSDPGSHLPGTTALPIAWNCDGNGSYVIKICWNESRIAVSGAATTSAGTSSASGVLCTWTGV